MAFSINLIANLFIMVLLTIPNILEQLFLLKNNMFVNGIVVAIQLSKKLMTLMKFLVTVHFV